MSKNRVQLNSVVSSQLPQYVQEDYPLVSSFLKQYYLGQEYQSGPVDLIQNIDEYIKLDTTTNLVESVVPKLVPLHNLTGILRELLSERVPISDLRSILESLASISSRNLSIVDTAEALRPTLAGLLIQQIAPLNQPLPVITLEADLEQMLIKMSRQSGEEGLVLDNELAQNLLTKISETNQNLTPAFLSHYMTMFDRASYFLSLLRILAPKQAYRS